jgi:hypothetical protein
MAGSVFAKIVADYERGVLTHWDVMHQLVDALVNEPLDTFRADVGEEWFAKIRDDLASHPWDDAGWERLRLIHIAGITERERPRYDPESIERRRREEAERDRRAKETLRASVEAFRRHFGIERPRESYR